MVNFNAAGREVCSVRNELTNTPLQALTLLNNKTFVEASRCLAENMLLNGGSQFPSQVNFAFLRILARPATAYEVQLLRKAYEDFHQQLSQDPAAARELLRCGEAPRNDQIDPDEHATMTLIASVILNLDETVTKQ